MNTFLIGLGNGMLGTFLMILGPKKVDKIDAEKAGFIMAFYLSMGRSLGSLISTISFNSVFIAD